MQPKTWGLNPMMAGMVLTGHGGLDKLEWREDLPIPSPVAGEVLIRVGASAVNNTDINLRTGWYSRSVRADTASTAARGEAKLTDGGWSGATLSFPMIQGADCCGIIVEVGRSVDQARIGQRVLVRALQPVRAADGGWTTRTPGTDYDGAFAEYLVVADADALEVRCDLSDVELASFPCSYSTAEAMIQRAGLGAERAVVTGASGGVGSAAIQLAKRRGAHVTAITRANKADALRALGADVILEREAEFPTAAFDVAIDLAGGPRWPALIDSLRTGGRYVVSGAIAGPIVELDLRTLYLRDLSFFGSTHQPESVFRDLVGYIEAGDIRPVIAMTYPLRELRAAQEAFLSKQHVGKIGIDVLLTA